jgi:putative ABC transport system permease protein
MDTDPTRSFAFRLLRRFCRTEYVADIEGDLLELHERRLASMSPAKARWLLLGDVIRLFRPGLIRSSSFSILNPSDMIRHNLLVAYRNFLRYKSSFLINLTGLSTGLACVLLIFLWVKSELDVDAFHSNAGRIYQVLENVDQGTGLITRESNSGPTAETYVAEFPEVEAAMMTTLAWGQRYMVAAGENNVRARGAHVGKDFFKIFSFPLIEGDGARALEDPNSLIVTRDMAIRLFGSTDNAVGKTVKVNNKDEMLVAAVMEDIPATSSVQFDMLFSWTRFWNENEWSHNWFNTAPTCYVLMKPGTDIAAFNAKIHDLVRTKTEGKANHRSPFVAKFPERYLYGRYENGMQAGGRIEYVTMFSIIAGFILLIACINFMNLSTARASRRTKEVGIKKAVGANSNSLVFQYLSESTVMAILSLLVAVLMVVLLLPQFNIITGKSITLDFSGEMLLIVVGATLITGLLAGSYPSLYLSSFKPAVVLKGKLSGQFGEALARKGLVVFQFTLSIVLIVSVWVVYEQIKLIQTRNLGYDRENIMMFTREGVMPQKQEAFLTEVSRIPGVVRASATGHDMTGHNGGTYGIMWPGKDPADRTEFERMSATYGTIDVLGITMKEGRNFSPDHPSDSSAIIFNEAAIAFMGMTDPLGKKVKWGDDEMEIVGVMRDFNFESFHVQVKPLFMFLNPRFTGQIIIKLEKGKEAETIARIEEFHTAFNPGFPLSYRFLDSEYQQMYIAESRVATLSKYFAALAVLISCLGLFGLAAFTAERRIKEIGIRKVLGSGVWGIVRLLTAEFTIMVVAAIAIAVPVSWYFTSQWLEEFVFRIELRWWFFVLSGLAALLIAWLTVGFQTFRAASASPVKSLRVE